MEYIELNSVYRPYLSGGYMAVKAIVLVTAELGGAAPAAQAISKIPGVKDVQEVTGPYDIIVTVQADDVNGIGKIVANAIQNAEGVDSTITCIAVDLS